jgi:uncharacterized membrane protein YdbT with pleckstrin-like domain
MTYIDESLGSNESLHYRARFPGARYAGAWGLLVLIGIPAILTAASGYDRIGLMLILVGLAVFVALMLPMWTTEIGVTTQRLIFKRGLFWRKTKELQLRAIEEVNLDQGLIGRLLNYGRINLHGTGLDDISLPMLAEPVALQRAIQEGIAAATQPTAAPVLGSPIAPTP